MLGLLARVAIPGKAGYDQFMAGRSKKIMLLVHPQFRPDRAGALGTERDVWRGLKRLGWTVQVAAARDNLRDFDKELAAFQPAVVFNLLEEFRGEAVFDFHLVAYLEALGVPFTGCNPRGLVQSRNKDLCGRLAASLGIAVPRGGLVGTPGLKFPVFVKLNREHASLGIQASNLVRDGRELQREVRRLRAKYGGEILAQEFISGHDVSVAVWGNARAEVLDPRRFDVSGMDRVATERLKFSAHMQKRRRARSNPYKGAAVRSIRGVAGLIFSALDMSGYARMDFRVTESHEAFLIDVNANPNLARDEDFSLSARARGWNYGETLRRITDLALRYRPRV